MQRVALAVLAVLAADSAAQAAALPQWQNKAAKAPPLPSPAPTDLPSPHAVPRPLPAPAAPSGGVIVLDGSAASREFDGHGGLSAGASSRLLLDYPEPQRSDILDLLFTPGVGAGLQVVKVEIGGDTQVCFGRAAVAICHAPLPVGAGARDHTVC
jgi:hypothetical protein